MIIYNLCFIAFFCGLAVTGFSDITYDCPSASEKNLAN